MVYSLKKSLILEMLSAVGHQFKRHISCNCYEKIRNEAIIELESRCGLHSHKVWVRETQYLCPFYWVIAEQL